MMDFIKNNRTTVIALAIVLGGVLVYMFFFREDPTQNTTGLTTFGNSDVNVTNQQFIALFGELQRIEIKENTDLFEDPYYRSLVDYSQPVSPEPVGRDNPFAPL